MTLSARTGLAGRIDTGLVALVGFLVPALAVAAPAPGHEEKGATFQAPGAMLYVEVLGTAPGVPLLVVNGGPGFDHTYEHAAMPGITSAWETLAQKRRVVFYDQRGNGRSGALKPGQPCGLAEQIEDLEAVRAHLGADQIDLLGHSWGGFLVMAYAARHPGHIRHLITVDSAAPKWGDTVFLFKDIFPEGQERADAFAFADALGDKAASDAGIREYLTWLFYSPEKRDAFIAQIAPGVYTKAVNEAVDHDVQRFDLNPELRKFKFPALVVTGRFDINVAPSVAYKIHKAIPGSKFVVLEKSGHLPFYEEPEPFVRAIEGFLGAGR
ncbi:MAG TPA: alpha/beta fold hydrolase [Kofleriaceae bacterium]|jgi:proline iminopeptidase|nr:alpha/beta fold hydrolase [Kofleriaceae bacterium]